MLKKIGIILVVVVLVIAASLVWRKYKEPKTACYGEDLGRSGTYGQFIGKNIKIVHFTQIYEATPLKRTRSGILIHEWKCGIQYTSDDVSYLVRKEEIILMKLYE